MGDLVFNHEVKLAADPAEVFGLFGSGDPSLGWLFGAEVPIIKRGALVRLAVPLGDLRSADGTARVMASAPCRRIDLRHETPWAGRVVCRFDPETGGGTRLRVRVAIDESEIARLGAELGLVRSYALPGQGVPLGLLTSLSGSAGILGRSTVNCAELAVEEVNADGGIQGRSVSLVVADDATDPEIGRLAMRRLISVAGLRAVVGMHSSATYAVTGPMAVAAGLPYLYTPTSEQTRPHRLLVRFGETPVDQLHQALPRLAAETGGRRWFFAGNDYSWPRAIGATARAVVERIGGTVVGEGYLPVGERRFEPLLDAIARSGADQVVSSFIGHDQVRFEREFAALGLRSTVRTFAPLIDDAAVEHLGEAAAGIWNVLGYFQGLDSPENREFLRRYRQRFGDCAPPVSAAAEGVYEAIHVWARACRRVDSTDPIALADGIRRERFTGPRRQRQSASRTRLLLGETTPSGVRVIDELPAARTAS